MRPISKNYANRARLAFLEIGRGPEKVSQTSFGYTGNTRSRDQIGSSPVVHCLPSTLDAGVCNRCRR